MAGVKHSETTSLATKRLSLYSNSGEQKTVTVQRHFVEAWNKESPWLVYEVDKMILYMHKMTVLQLGK